MLLDLLRGDADFVPLALRGRVADRTGGGSGGVQFQLFKIAPTLCEGSSP